MNNNEFLINNPSVEIEPKQNFHFRYESEIKQGNSHGALNGQEGDHTKIKLRLPKNGHLDECGNKRDFFVLCSLHCFNNNRTLSPHLLLPKGDSELNYEFIFNQMDVCADNPEERVWELRDYVIVRLKTSEYKTSLINKATAYDSLELPFDFANLLGQLDINNAQVVKFSGKLNVCLGFTIFERDFYQNTYSLYRDTIYSCNIYHGDDLKIKSLCNLKGSIHGGTEVTILIRLEPNLPLNIFIKRIDENTRKTVWSTTVKVLDEKIFLNAAVTFTMPPYGGPKSNDDEIEVHMCVMVENSTYKSDNAKFFYMNERPRKRPRVTEQPDYTVEQRGNVSTQSSEVRYVSCDHETLPEPEFSFSAEKNVDIKFKIDKIFKTPKDLNLIFPHELLYSIFYDALESEEAFKHLYKMANDASNNKLVADFRNENRENLLHLACQMNKYKRIRPLIGLGCHINEQDYIGRTPLHVALARQDIDCIAEILYIFNNISKYPHEVETDLMKMIRAYNHDGHTVLHAAILGQYKELCEAMLKFMHKHNINVLDFEVLGSGDSIVHLAVKHNLITIWPLIEEYVPNYKMVKNYAGIIVSQLECGMLQNLKI